MAEEALTTEQAIEIVVQVAFEWAGEYGFDDPEGAGEVWAAAKLLRPDLEPRPVELPPVRKVVDVVDTL